MAKTLMKTLTGTYLDLKIYYEVKSKNEANKQTVFTLSVYGYYDGQQSTTASSTNYKLGKSGDIKVVRTAGYTIGTSARTVLLGSTDITVTHTEPDSPATTVSYSMYDSVNFTSTQSGTLTIPKGASKLSFKAVLTDAPDFNNTKTNPTITYDNSKGNSMYSLQACISLTGSTDDISYRDISKTGSSYTFSLSTTDMNKLIAAIPNNKRSTTIRFYIRSKLTESSSYEHSYLEKTFSLADGKISFSNISIKDSNTNTKSLTGDDSKFVKGHSNAAISFTATSPVGATISSYKVTCGSKSITARTGTINAVESGTFTITATDVRGYTGTTTVNKTLINYPGLTCTLEVEITNPANGTFKYTIGGTQFTGSFGSTTNVVKMRIIYREKGTESWNQSDELTSKTGTMSLDYSKTWEVKAIASDKIYTSAVGSDIRTLTFTPSFYWNKDNFYFNQDIHVKGTNIIDRLFYKPGDSYSQSISTAGYITTSKSQINFSVPLGKHLGLVNQFTLSQISLTARQNNLYIYGSGTAGANCVGRDFDTTATVKDGFLNIVIKKYTGATHDSSHQSPFSTDAINNDVVGIQATITGSWSYDSSITSFSTDEEIIIEDDENDVGDGEDT